MVWSAQRVWTIYKCPIKNFRAYATFDCFKGRSDGDFISSWAIVLWPVSAVLRTKGSGFQAQNCRSDWLKKNLWVAGPLIIKGRSTINIKRHDLKFQTLEGPDGLGISCVHAYDGRRGDGYIFRHSDLENFWRKHPIASNYRKFADSAYPTTNWTFSMFKKLPGQELPPDRQDFNATYSPMQICVEWGYEKVLVRHWAYIDFKKQIKMEMVQMEVMWHGAFWLTNVVTCIRGGNQISEYFELSPPTLEAYLRKTLER